MRKSLFRKKNFDDAQNDKLGKKMIYFFFLIKNFLHKYKYKYKSKLFNFYRRLNL